MAKKIFLSHAAKDKVLADYLVDLLQTGTNISHDDIFCSSLEGLGIPPGKDFIEWIKSELQQPDVVIALLTPNYLDSHFCLCELGATWAMSHNMLPLLVPPLNYNDIDGVISVTQVSKIDNDDDMNEFASHLKEYLGDSKINIARWGLKKKKFLKGLKKVLSEIEAPVKIDPNEHKKISDMLVASQEALENLDDENDDLKNKIFDLKKCKDAEEVRSVEEKYSTDHEKLESLIGEVSKKFSVLPGIVAYIAFKNNISNEPVEIDPFDGRDSLKDVEDATDKEFLIYDDPGFFINEQHPKVKRAMKALNKLDKFLIKEADPDLFDNFEEEYDYPLSLTNREFWNENIHEWMSRY